MKLITAIAALALVAGSMDVEAQQRKNLNKKAGMSGKPEAHQMAREVAEDGQPQNVPVAHLAIGAFSQLDPEERKDLAEAAEGGAEEAMEELSADAMAAIEAMIGALEDEDARGMIGLGMMLAGLTNGNFSVQLTGDKTEFDKQASADGEHFDPISVDALGTDYWNSRTYYRDSRLLGDTSVDENLDDTLDMVKEQLEALLKNFEPGVHD